MFRLGLVSGVKYVGGILIMVMLLSACQTPVGDTNLPGASPSQSPGMVTSSPSATPVSPVTTPSATASIPPSPTPSPTKSSASAAAGTVTVLMKVDGKEIVLPIGMGVAAFHKKADSLGWSCSPKSGTDKYGTVRAGLNQFDFIDGELDEVYIGNPAFSTEKGLRVGDSIATMKRLYGEPDSQSTLPDNGGVIYSFPLAETFGMDVSVKAGKVAGMLFS